MPAVCAGLSKSESPTVGSVAQHRSEDTIVSAFSTMGRNIFDKYLELLGVQALHFRRSQMTGADAQLQKLNLNQ